jgi:hypothetical protein
MRLFRVRDGRQFTVWALDRSSGAEPPEAEAIRFVEDLPAADRRSLVALLGYHADYGPITNEQK